MSSHRAWKYEMAGTILSKTTTMKEKVLGVTINAHMEVSEQSRIAASMVTKILIIIFVFEIKESIITRGHNITLMKKESRLDARKFFSPEDHKCME